MKTEAIVPALRQSIQAQMACETGYSLVHIRGLKPPNTLESQRGTEVHDVLAKYAEHCAKNRVTVDFQYLEALAYDKGQEAAEIIETCKENIEIDWQNFFAAEIHVGLDRNWEPTYAYDHDGNQVEMSSIWARSSSGRAPEHSGILDVIYLYPGGTVVKIEDYKTHPRAFDADTFQGKLYALFVFMHMQQVEEVTFQLNFVRYANVKRPHTYYRRDVPKLKEDVQRYRERQLQIHAKVAAGQELSVHPGAHCQYCPAISNFTCPIAELNPHLNLSPEERLKWRLWLDVANRVNNKAMKEFVDATEQSIYSTDENGHGYSYGPVLKEKTTYPLFVLNEETGLTIPIVEAIQDWILDPENNDLKPTGKSGIPWWLKLRIGATELTGPLGARKRELLDNRLKDLADRRQVTEVRVERAAEVDDGQGEEHREYGSEEVA